MPDTSPVKTRAKRMEEERSRERSQERQATHDLRRGIDYPASPSADASSSAYVPPAREPPAHRTHATIPPPIEEEDRESIRQRERGHRAPSVCSVRSHASYDARRKRAELEAAEEFAKIQREYARAQREALETQAMLVRKKLAADLATLREETDRESVFEEATDVDRRIQEWVRGIDDKRGELRPDMENREELQREARCRSPIERVPERDVYERHPRDPHHDREPRRRSPSPPARGRDRSGDRMIERLTESMERMSRLRAPSRQTTELPVFSGAIGDWLPFKVAMEESTRLHRFSKLENIGRLRSCLKGEARETVSSLLSSATDPAEIMRTLEQTYGTPKMLIRRALDDLDKLPRFGTTAHEVNRFAVKLQNVVTVIKNIDKDWLKNGSLVQRVMEKIPQHVKFHWTDYVDRHRDEGLPRIVMLADFMMKRAKSMLEEAYDESTPSTTATTSAQARQAQNRNVQKQANRSNANSKGAPVYATTAKESSTDEKKSVCFCCGSEHETPSCSKLKAMPVRDRWDWAREARICFQCLNGKHRKFRCRSKRCGVDECRGTHHALLHTPRGGEEEPAPKEESVIAAAAHLTDNRDRVLLKVCPVTLESADGKEIEAYALLDEGSTITLIDAELARMVGAEGPTRNLRIHGVTSSQQEPESRVVPLRLRGRTRCDYHEIKARTVNSLTLGIHSVERELLKCSHLRKLRPEDVCHEKERPRLLIGADNWHLIVTRKLLTGKRSQPAASLTRLGWVIHGSIPGKVVADEESVLYVRTLQQMSSGQPESFENDELHELVKNHFGIDALGISRDKKLPEMEKRAVEIFNATARRVDGRFEAGLPWITDDVTLPPSYNMALNRLKGIERKMDRSPEFRRAYSAQIEGLLEKKYAVKCEEDHHNHPRTWYLPHFAVTNPNKPGKVRLVFDAAARANGMCLNDALLDGPDLLKALPGVLFRFRKKPVAITADIREMFLRVKIRPEDAIAQHFLWRGDDRRNPPQKYIMTSMIFGAKSSPFMAHSVRDRNAAEYKDSHPLAYHAITQNHYMDDWVDSFENVDQATRTVREVIEVHGYAGFQLASWRGSDSGPLETIPSEDRAFEPQDLGPGARAHGNTLGLRWLPETDHLAFNTVLPRVPEAVRSGGRIPSKREVLGAVMSLYDPLGLLSPYTVSAKIVLQGLWRNKMEWDDQIPAREAIEFGEWIKNMETIANLRIPRCYDKGNIVEQELHVFCDASDQAYATAAYWRLLRDNGTINVVLIAGRAKVAPIKAQSIPRLELQASLIGARLARTIIDEHHVEGLRVILWSDSRTALHWIRNDSARYTPFVAHRLCEIAELTKPSQWRWVPTDLNVADDATRAGYTRMKSEDRWFKGPHFLYDPEDCWPRECPVVEQMDDEVVGHARMEESWIDFNRCSSYERLVRTYAYVVAFVEKCKRRASGLELRHLERAERLLIEEAQKESFQQERYCLRKERCVDRASRLRKLDVALEDGIIRLNGRIGATTVREQENRPPVLDGRHALTQLIIKDEHESNHHIGREHLVSNLRQRYYILQLRPTVRKILRNCVVCCVKRAQPVAPVKGDLPGVRMNIYERPFTCCGVDCFGPMTVAVGRRREKRWGMIFTCLTTRAVHIELIASLDVNSAVMALRRMAARRGWPRIMWSDNGTNFRGADVELRKASEEWMPELKDYALSKRMEWRFIDPGAPNQGGAWERLVRSVKNALAVTLKERAPKPEVLDTVMAEVEYTLNARPLTHVSVDADSEEPLTPNHFLLGMANGLPLVGTCTEADRRSWRVAQALSDAFWSRWIKEYLPTLLPRGDVRKASRNVETGDLVVIVDGLLPRNVWPRGLVVKTYAGSDGVVRSADVRTRGGVFRRPVRRLVVLPRREGLESLRRGEDVTDN